MANRPRKYICEICGEEAETTNSKIPKTCKNKDCRSKYKSLTNGNIGKQKGKWVTKICPNCGSSFETRISREKTYCSNLCSLRSEERKENLKEKYTGVSLLDRGYSEKKLQEHIDRNTKRNKSLTGQKWEESFGEEVAIIMKEKMSQINSSSGNPMSYESVMERLEIDSFEEAREKMPATGRFGEKHPFFGKHHSVKSKTQMIETFEKNGHFNILCGYFDKIYFQGTWELKYIIDCIENNIPIKRFDLEPIYYEFEGKPHHYFPDFIINGNVIVEIKGRLFDPARIEKKKNIAKKTIKNFKHITDVGQKQNPKTFLRLMKSQYKERLQLVNNPYKEKI